MRAILLLVALGGVAHADPARAPTGVAVGVEVVQPTAATVGWSGLHGLLGVDAAVGTGTTDGHGLYLAAAVTTSPVLLAHSSSLRVPLYFAIGARRYDHHYAPMSIDEIPDVETGIDVQLGIGVALHSGLELVVRGGPGWDVARTDSCTLMSGVNSLCPHAQSTRAFWTGVVAARWWL